MRRIINNHDCNQTTFACVSVLNNDGNKQTSKI